MPDQTQPAVRPILVAASSPADAALARSAVEELDRTPVLIQDEIAAMRALCRCPGLFAAVVVGERIQRATGLTLCAVSRDAGCRLPMLLLTHDACRWSAMQAARLQVTVLWQPVPAGRVARVLVSMLPHRPGSATGERLSGPGAAQRLTAAALLPSASALPATTSR